MGINTGDLTHDLRQEQLPANSMGYLMGVFAANHFSEIKNVLRPVLTLADTAHALLGSGVMRQR